MYFKFSKLIPPYCNEMFRVFKSEMCMIKILGGGGVVDGEGGSSERCLKWGSGGSLRDLSKNSLKQGVGKGISCS